MLTVSIGRWENAKPAPSLGWAGRDGGDRATAGTANKNIVSTI
jgi:hypothetical protein